MPVKDTRVCAFLREPLLGLGLRAGLQESAFRLESVANDAGEIGTLLETFRPQIFLYDYDSQTGPAELLSLMASTPDCRFVLFAGDLTHAQATQLMDRGVSGLLKRNSSVAAIVACLERVAQGHRWLDPDFEAMTGARRGSPRLSRREGELVRLVLAGLANKEIGNTLCITEGTVKVYLSKLFRKVGVRDRLDLALYGVRHLGLPPRGPGDNAVQPF